jgi:hypothetical protein
MAKAKSTTDAPDGYVDLASTTHVRSSEFRNIYSNNIRVSTSPTEVRITFSQFVDGVGPQTFINQEEACIIINPGLVRPFMRMIENALENHEKMWGTIELPKGIVPATEPNED